MTARQFLFHMFLWAVICLVASTPVGALLGFMLHFVWTFFAMLLSAAGAAAVFKALSGLLMLVALVAGVLGITRLLRRDSRGAFGWWSTCVAFIGINSTIWLSIVAASRSIWGF
jgi:uncharacterized membrane protein